MWIAYGGGDEYIGGQETHAPRLESGGVNPDPELRIFLEHFLIPLRLIGSGHSLLSLKLRERNGLTSTITIDSYISTQILEH